MALAAIAGFLMEGLFILSPASPGHGWYFMLFFGAALRFVGDEPEESVPQLAPRVT